MNGTTQNCVGHTVERNPGNRENKWEMWKRRNRSSEFDKFRWIIGPISARRWTRPHPCLRVTSPARFHWHSSSTTTFLTCQYFGMGSSVPQLDVTGCSSSPWRPWSTWSTWKSLGHFNWNHNQPSSWHLRFSNCGFQVQMDIRIFMLYQIIVHRIRNLNFQLKNRLRRLGMQRSKVPIKP